MSSGLDCQYNNPYVLGTIVNIFEGTTVPRTMPL